MVFHVFPWQPPLPFSWWCLPISSPQPPIDLEGHASGPEDYWEKVVFQTSTSVYYIIYIYIYVSWDGTIPGYSWALRPYTKKPASFVWKIPSAVHGFHVGSPWIWWDIFTNNKAQDIHPLLKKHPVNPLLNHGFWGVLKKKIAGMALFGPQNSFC